MLLRVPWPQTSLLHLSALAKQVTVMYDMSNVVNRPECMCQQHARCLMIQVWEKNLG